MTPRRSPLLGFAALLLATTATFAQPALPPPGLPGPGPATATTKPTEPADPAVADRKALDAANLKADDPKGLLDYLRQRTLSDTDLSKIQAVIRRLGSDDFAERLKAAVEVERFGPAAVGPLRAASQNDTDYEVAYQAGECLKRMEKV